MKNKILLGDSLEILKTLPDESVNCCVTSPPYWCLRDYGIDGQIGLEDTPEEYIEKIVVVFREVRRVLRKDGTLWLNMGDSYASGASGRGDCALVGNHGRTSQKHSGERKPRKLPSGMKPKDLCGIPWMLAFALRADDWYLRQDLIWSKPNPMPESVKDRCTKSHEYIFLLSKSQRYYYDYKAIQEDAKSISNSIPDGWMQSKGSYDVVEFSRRGRTEKSAFTRRKQYNASQGGGGTSFLGHSGNYDAEGNLIGNRRANKRSVWTVSTQPFRDAHFATFPEKLIEPCILAGCPPEGIVLDPFIGAGTTAIVARKLNRNFFGIELNPKYIEIAMNRLHNEIPLFL